VADSYQVRIKKIPTATQRRAQKARDCIVTVTSNFLDPIAALSLLIASRSGGSNLTGLTLSAAGLGRDPPLVRIYVCDGGDCGARFHTSLLGGTDPGFDRATTDKRHVKHCAALRWCADVEFTPGRLAAALQSDIDAIVLHSAADPDEQNKADWGSLHKMND
jgi:hypothetical protein